MIQSTLLIAVQAQLGELDCEVEVAPVTVTNVDVTLSVPLEMMSGTDRPVGESE